MKIIDRYVYAVTRNLPQNQRVDVERELKNLINDRMNAHEDTQSDEKRAEQVLLELGDPNVLAQRYSEGRKFLVGPQNYHNYILVLRIVLGSILFAVTIGTILKLMFSGQEINLFKAAVRYLGSLITASLQGFIWVTFVFVILDYKGVNTNKKYQKDGTWSIFDLPEIPKNKALIPKNEPIFSIIFSTVFIMILYFAPQYFGVVVRNRDSRYSVIPFFNIEVLSSYNALLLAVFLTILIKEVLKIIVGRWTLGLSLSVAFLNIAGLLIMLVIFLNPAIFNTCVPIELLKSANLKIDAAVIWNIFKKWFWICFITGYVIDTLVALYKGIRYSI